MIEISEFWRGVATGILFLMIWCLFGTLICSIRNYINDKD